MRTPSRKVSEAYVIILFILIAIVVLRVAYDKYLGVRVTTPKYVDVTGRSLPEIVEIGTKASGSLLRRAVGRPVAAQAGGSSATWDVPSKGSVMTFQVDPLGTGLGFRVSGQATIIRTEQNKDRAPHVRYKFLSIWGRSVRMTNAIYRMLGIPYKAGRMLRIRRRVLRAVATTA